MDGENDKLICRICGKKYSSASAKYRHLREVHNEQLVTKQTVHIKCPICPQEEKVALESHDMLIHHLQQIHSLTIKTSLFTFKNEEEFETWRGLDNRNVDYIKRRDRKVNNGQVVYYECNRSYYSGYTSQCSKRRMKTGGSIKISGFCPSRIRVKICSAAVDVRFVETHVGHDNLLQSEHLTKDRQKTITSKLTAEVPKESILEDARTVTKNKINVLKKAVGTPIDDNENSSYLSQPSTSRTAYEMDVQSVIGEHSQISNYSIASTTDLDVVLEQARIQLGLLDDGNLRNMAKMIRDAYNLQCSTSRKRKIEELLHFPSKK